MEKRLRSSNLAPSDSEVVLPPSSSSRDDSTTSDSEREAIVLDTTFSGFEQEDIDLAQERLLTFRVSVVPLKMPTAEEMAETEGFLAEISRITTDFDDEYRDLEWTSMPAVFRKRYTERLEADKERVRKISTHFEMKEHAGFISDDQKGAIKALKLEMIAKVRAAWQHLDDVSWNTPHNTILDNSRNTSTPNDVRQGRLQDLYDVQKTLLEHSNSELKLLEAENPGNKREMREWKVNWDLCKADLERIEKEFLRINKDSVDFINPSLHNDSSQALAKIREYMKRGRTCEANFFKKLEISQAGGVERSKVNIKPPSFSGSLDQTDYFTFSKHYKDYCEAHDLSRKEKEILLKNSILTGEALASCEELESEESILAHLKLLYGRPLILIGHKVRDIQKLGKCPRDTMQKRTWLIHVSTKLNALYKLADEHKLISTLEHSPAVASITELFTPEMYEKYDDQIQLENEGESLTPTIILNFLMKYLKDLIIKCTGSVDLKLNIGAPIPNGAEKVTGRPARGGKSAYLTTGSTDPQNEASSAPSRSSTKNKRSRGKEGNKGNKNIFVNLTDKPVLKDCSECGGKHTYLYLCKKFQKCVAKSRWFICARTEACPRCLRLDAGYTGNKGVGEWYAKHKVVCNNDWLCEEENCKSQPEMRRQHFLLCGKHWKDSKVRAEEFIKNIGSKNLPQDTRFFPLAPAEETISESESCHFSQSNDCPTLDDFSAAFSSQGIQINGTEMKLRPNDVDLIMDPPIYMVQTTPSPSGKPLLIFYDSGCYGASLNKRAYNELETLTLRAGPTVMNVAGGRVVELPHGDELFRLPLTSKQTLPVVGLYMDKISTEFPSWNLLEASRDLQEAYSKDHSPSRNLPAVPSIVGGTEVDVMLGIRYNLYYPKLIFTLPSGLEIRETCIVTCDGTTGVLAGPHHSWRHAANSFKFITPASFLSYEMSAYRSINSPLLQRFSSCFVEFEPEENEDCQPDINYDGADGCHDDLSDGAVEHTVVAACFQHVSKSLRDFQSWEDCATEVSYRCVKCRNCSPCKSSSHLEATSLQDEREQLMVESAVRFDELRRQLVSRLPFTFDPKKVLVFNRGIAQKVLETQLRKIDRDPSSRADILFAHEKLESKGHVFPLSSLPHEVQNEVMAYGYFIPWRTVSNPGSLSTPCRLVFDASSKTPGGQSLNDVLARGTNSVASLFKLLINFRFGPHCFTTDISLAYNSIKLDILDYKFQKYLWCRDLTVGGEVIVMIIGTLIYGVRPSGNLMAAGFSKLGDYILRVRPELILGVKTLKDKAYVDDILAAFFDKLTRDQAAENLVEVLSVAGIGVKAICKSGSPPPEVMSADGQSVGLVGYSWFPENDLISLEEKPLYLGKKVRGKLPEIVTGDLKEALRPKFTKRILAGKVASLFDPLGLFCPLAAKLKVDLSEIFQLKVDWDDLICDDKLLDTWVTNLCWLNQASQIRVPRSVTHPQGSGRVQLLVCADASQYLACAAVYVRQEVEGNQFSCRLLTAKNKLATKKSIPKAEIFACTMAAALGHTVRAAWGDSVESMTFVTDSTVSLYWINSDHRPLQTFVRNCSIEIARLTSLDDWYHVRSEINPADLGTRPADEPDLGAESVWMTGYSWMTLPKDDMPIKRVHDVVLDKDERVEVAKEVKVSCDNYFVASAQMTARSAFSNYFLDPIALGWKKYHRIISVLSRCCRIWRHRAPPFPVIAEEVVLCVMEEDVREAERIIFQKTTLEVKKFVKPGKLEGIGREDDGVLRYVSRILDGTRAVNHTKFSFDVTPYHFCKPILDHYSPIAWIIMKFVHISVAKHAGVPAVVRLSRGIAFILEAKTLAQRVRDGCALCQRIQAKLSDITLAPLHENRLVVAPAFFFTQMDIAGPFDAYSEHNHKSIVKIWCLVFKCTVTMACHCAVMEKYSADSFISAFTRFVSLRGVPQRLYIDQGSQLMAGLKGIEYRIADLTKAINGKWRTGIHFDVAPTGLHMAIGLAERSIRSVKDLFDKTFFKMKLSVLGYETSFVWIANELNNLPLCLGSNTKDLEALDLLTPNRLLLGRNNDRALLGRPQILPLTKLERLQREVEERWLQQWSEDRLLNLLPESRQGGSGAEVNGKVGDIVIFTRSGADNLEAWGRSPWRLGRICKIEDKDKVRSCWIEYSDGKAKKLKKTFRSLRTLVVLNVEEETDEARCSLLCWALC